MTLRQLTIVLAAGASALAASVCAQEHAPPLAERTGESDLPLEGARAGEHIEHASLSILVDPAHRQIAGAILYRIVATAPLDRLALDLDPRFAISDVSVDDTAIAPGRWRNPDGLLTIDLPRPLAAGDTAILALRYRGAPHVAANPPWEGGMTWSETPDGQPWIASTVQGEGCDLFWPCIDSSAHRIDTMDLLVTVPEALTAAGNGRLIGTTDNDDGTRTFHWRARNPSNYGIALQIAPYELARRDYASRFGNIVPIRFWHLPGHDDGVNRLLGEMEDFLAFFESTVGPYPFADEKAGIAETPHLGMEHQTINAYGNGFARDPLGYDWLLHHEFAHEWFGNQLTHASINHMWLHEGLGTWMQPLYLERTRGRMQYDAEMWRYRTQIASRVPLVSPDAVRPDYNDSDAGWGTDIYYKGAWVLHTLRHLVGDEVLFPAITRLVYGTDDPRPGAIRPVTRTTDDFRRILEDKSGRDLRWFFDAYFTRADLPRLASAREGGDLLLEWQTPSRYPFEMPVEVEIDGNRVSVPMTGGRAKLALDSGDRHVLLDPDNRILRADDAIAAWRAAQEERREAAAAE
ncbi:M1 family metallopeptidase [Aurantiacibacter spongiae]|uniref:M1 family peptidase n=1 Tax=Aurantiacibacter spongiae TaxID=2488860 RepID=A0A3N5CSP0_9SPHN|nr:M1 family metallopeptidase [Aurantiacibacter spongiae]RPF71366.1 M1 family peptidase [Aurantiacibacter spongiae]